MGEEKTSEAKGAPSEMTVPYYDDLVTPAQPHPVSPPL
jgi:hypothetical protein